MALIFDNIIATIVAVTIIMALLTTQLRVQQGGVEQVSAHAAKTKALSLGRWLEDDITSLGANFGRNLSRFEVPEADQWGNTSTWVFYSDSLQDDGGTMRHVTRYRLELVETLEMGEDDNGEEVVQPLYQLHRETAASQVVNGAMLPVSSSQWAADGKSVATMSRFRISLVDRGGFNTSDVLQSDFIRVEFAMLPEFERGRGYLHELYWNTLLKVRPFWQPPAEA